MQLEKAQDKKGKPTGKLEIQAGIILFRPTTKETKGKHKFLMEFEELGTADIDTEDETTQLERMGKVEKYLFYQTVYNFFSFYRCQRKKK